MRVPLQNKFGIIPKCLFRVINNIVSRMPAYFIINYFYLRHALAYNNRILLQTGISFTGFPDDIVLDENIMGNPGNKNTIPSFGMPGQSVVFNCISFYHIMMGAVSFSIFPEVDTGYRIFVDMVAFN